MEFSIACKPPVKHLTFKNPSAEFGGFLFAQMEGK